MVTDLGCLAWDTWKGFFSVREHSCLKSIRAGPKATPPRSQSQFSNYSCKNLAFLCHCERPRIAELRIWDSLSLGLYLNSLHLSFNLGILGPLLRMVILIYSELECSPTKAGSWIPKPEYAHRNKSPWSNPSRGDLRFLNSAIKNVPCGNNPRALLSPHGSQRDNGRW